MYSVSRHALTLQLQNSLRPVVAAVSLSSPKNFSTIKNYHSLRFPNRKTRRLIYNWSSSAVFEDRSLSVPVGGTTSHFTKFIGSESIIAPSFRRHYSQPAEQQTVDNKSNESQSTSNSQSTDDEGGEGETEGAVQEFENEYDLSLTDEEIQKLTNGDPELIKKVKYIQLEHSVFMQEGHLVPNRIPFKFWFELLPLDSRSKRKKFYEFLFKTEMRQLSQRKKKIQKMEQRLKDYEENPLPTKEEDMYGMTYCLNRNTLFLRLYDTTINKFYSNRLANAMLHSPPLVYDCSYIEYMTIREQKNCARQLEFVIGENRQHRDPYDLHFCNLVKGTPLRDFLYRMMPNLDQDNFVINIHEESFMDLFPPERLVYLTPHCRDDLEEYSEDDIYIIGAMVDKTDPRPYSMAKAKKLNIRMKRLPIDMYVMWGLGKKSLTINSVHRIMTDVRYLRGDWKEALIRHLPWRKLSRDYHPYPGQEQSQQDEESFMPKRRERKSLVLEDSELLNMRKGYRRSDVRSSPSLNDRRYDAERARSLRVPKMRSLLHDD